MISDVPLHDLSATEPQAPKGRNTKAQGNALGRLTAMKRKPQRGEINALAMPQSLATILVHFVFSTKHRHPWIQPEIDAELYAYQARVLQEFESPALTINGTEDHVHILFHLGLQVTVADIVEEVKKRSSKWIKSKGPAWADFYWQAGYGAFSIGQSSVDALRQYIARQKKHHRTKTFRDEYRQYYPSTVSNSTSDTYGIDGYFAPLGLESACVAGPRALPWAFVLRPVGARVGVPCKRN